MDPAALSRLLTHIQANLDGDLSLQALAAVAGCSPPYFSRRFARLMAESPKRYTSRLRLERAALQLVLLDDCILDISLDCGFACHETFCRAFRRRFGVAPHAFRRAGRLPAPAARSAAAAEQEVPQRVAASSAAPEMRLSSTVVRTLQPMSLAFIRHTGPYERVPIGLWDTLIAWMRRRAIPGRARPYVLLGIAHDAPGITAPEKLRFDAAVRVPGEFRTGGRTVVGHQHFAGGLFALTTSVGPFASLPAAYMEIFRRVQSDKALECLGVPCLEFYRVNRIVADLAVVSTEIAVPVRRRR
ncbi:MAG: AraC family transcriptional regulator [Phycisphaerales bacterium]|nr:AraC family transcriptional regulator [Phycisphaerales bacterium]